MTKYTVIYSCGHDGVVDIIGPHKTRQSYARIAGKNSRLKKRKKWDCRK